MINTGQQKSRYNRPPLSPLKWPLPMWGSGPPSNTRFLQNIQVHNPNDTSIGSAILHSSPVSLYFTMGRLFPSQNCPLPWGIWIHGFLGPTQVLNANGIWIGSAVLAGLTTVTDWPTDHITQSVTIGQIYIHSTVMRPNNNNKWTDLVSYAHQI